MSNSILHQLNSCSPIVCYNIASDIWLTMLTIHNNTIVGTLLNSIAPHQRHGPGFVVVAHYLHSILMTFSDCIVKDLAFVILHFNADAADLHFILDDVCINIHGCNYS